MTSQDFINLENQYGANNYKPMNVVLSKGRGVWVWDVDGKKYLDCLSAYSAVNQGHCHPKILKSMEEQARLLTEKVSFVKKKRTVNLTSYHIASIWILILSYIIELLSI